MEFHLDTFLEVAAVIITAPISVPILIGAAALRFGETDGNTVGGGAVRGAVAINNNKTKRNFGANNYSVQINTLNSDKQNQYLSYQGIRLEDTNTLKSYNIANNSITTMSIGTQVSSIRQKFIDSIYLDPHWDRDYTNLTREHIKRMKGGYQYYRPCGWKRIAIKVTGKYSDDKWLGHTGAEGEWAVTYHGTKQPVFEKICEEGYKVGPGEAFGKGVYSSPDINVAQYYAKQFLINGVTYLGIFQNRVNPKGVNIKNDGKFWVCPDPKDIRPYGLCVKRYVKFA